MPRDICLHPARGLHDPRRSMWTGVPGLVWVADCHLCGAAVLLGEDACQHAVEDVADVLGGGPRGPASGDCMAVSREAAS